MSHQNTPRNRIRGMRLWKRRGVSSRLRPPRVPRGVRGLQPHRGVVPSQHRSQNIAGSFWCPDKKPSSSRDIVMPGTAAAPHARRWRGFSFELSAQAATAVTSGPTKATRGPPGGANIFGAALRQQSPPGREAGTRRPAAEACRGEKPAPRGLSKASSPVLGFVLASPTAALCSLRLPTRLRQAGEEV